MSLLANKSGIFLGRIPKNIFVTRTEESILYDDVYFAMTGKDIFAGIGSNGFDDIYQVMTGQSIYAGMEDPSGFNDIYTALSGRGIFAGMNDDAFYDDIYRVASNTDIYAGMVAPPRIPAWRRNLKVNEWTTVASTGTIAAINPRNNPAINPNFPNKAEWEAIGSVSAVVSTWCGGCYDYQNHNMWLPLGGGHADYAGNEPYAINMSVDNPVWRMVRPPTGALPDAIITNDAQENSGVYADGRPRAIHSYNKCVFIPDYGPAVVPQGSTSWSAAGGTMRPIIIDHITGEMKRFGASQGVHSPGNYSGGGSCYDPTRRAVWIRGIGTGRFQRYNVDTDDWTREVSNSSAVSGSSALCYIESHDCILWFHQSFANGFAVLDCVTGVITQPQVTGVCVGIAPAPNGGMLRPHGLMQPHHLYGNTFAFWDNTTDTTIINTLSFTNNPRTDTWQFGQLPVAPSNTVTPTGRTRWGTYGRFFHMPEYKCVGVYNDVAQPVYIYRYE